MTWHIHYTHQCEHCAAFYIPYDSSVVCPQCGQKEHKIKKDFISQAAISANVNLQQGGSFIPGAWYVSSFADHILYLLFQLLEEHRTAEPNKPFEQIARDVVDRIDFGDQKYLREHLYDISLKVKSELDNNKSNKSSFLSRFFR